LHHAIECSRTEIIPILLSVNANVNLQDVMGVMPLHIVAAMNNWHMVNLLCESGAIVHLMDKEGKTPLHFAAEQCCVDIAMLLVYFKSDINAKRNR